MLLILLHKNKHQFQRRKNAEKSPYINHPIAVATILAECGVADLNILIAAVLHDTVEDTDTSFEEIEEKFGEKVCNLVKEVSDDKSLPKAERKRLQVEHAVEASEGARLIKMADKLHNLQTLLVSPPTTWDPKRIQGYFVWSKKVIDACCTRNSNKERFSLNTELESKLAKVFASQFTFPCKFDCIPVSDSSLDDFLESYYQTMERTND